MQILRRAISVSLFCVSAIVWGLFLRPQSMGGPISNIAVSGSSMLPTFESGDFLIVKRERTYSEGDVVVYSIPEGEVGAGSRIVHRIVGGDADGFVIRGDNNSSIDPWLPTNADIVGQVWFRIPRLANILAYLRNPTVLALSIAFMTLSLLLIPTNLRMSIRDWLRT